MTTIGDVFEMLLDDDTDVDETSPLAVLITAFDDELSLVALRAAASKRKRAVSPAQYLSGSQ